jgi:hypothetical protein
MYLYGERPICQSINKYKCVCIKPCMEKDEVIEDDETKTTLKVPAELLDDFKHLARLDFQIRFCFLCSDN